MADIFKNIGSFCSDHKSEILLGGGIAAGVVGLVFTVVETIKIVEEIEECNETIDEIKNSEYPSDEDMNKDIRNEYIRSGLKIAGRAAGPLLAATASLILVIEAYKTEKNKASEAIATIATLSSFIAKYRAGVVERYGSDVDRDIIMGRHVEEVETEVVDPKTGKVKKKKEYKVSHNPISPDIYSREWGPYTSDSWSTNVKKNRASMDGWQMAMQRIVDSQDVGYVKELYEYFSLKNGVDNGYDYLPADIGWISNKVLDILPEEWDWKGRHYVKAEYSGHVDLGIIPERLEMQLRDIKFGLRDDPYILHPNCYPTDGIREFATYYIRKNKKAALALDEETLRAFCTTYNG